MTKIPIILLCLLTFTTQAQDPARIHKGDPQKIIISYVASIALNAVGDALNQKGEKGWGHACNAASIGILLSTPFYINYDRKDWYKYILSYTFLRIGMFDPIHNAVSGQPLTYVGGDNLWDKTVSKVSPGGMTFIRGCSIVVGVAIPINELGWRIPKVKN